MVSARFLTIVSMTAIGLLLGLSAPAMAHATEYSDNDQLKFVYGNLGEPVYTFQKTGLDLGIVDNATNVPIKGLVPTQGSPTFEVWLIRGSNQMKLNITEQHGKSGWYTYPYMLTEPGVYNIHIKGTINGTLLDQVIEGKHAIEEMDTIMWPKKVANQDELEARIAALESQIETNGHDEQGARGSSPGLGAPLLIGVLLVGLVLLRRRNGN